MTTHAPITGTHRGRRGTAYVVAVGMGMMVAAIALAGIAFARARARADQIHRDQIQARNLARSAIELARALIKSDSNWRSSFSNGTWVSSQPLASGTLAVSVQNPSGALGRSALDSVVVTGDARRGLARQRLSVQLDAKLLPLTCLSTALTSGGTITATAATINSAGMTIASNVGYSSVLATTKPNVEAVTLIVGTGFQGTTTTGVTARTLPASTAFDTYVASGTSIPVSSLPTVLGKPQLTKLVLGPASNPYGMPDPNGIYIIDCQNTSITISNVRIVGTLVLLNPGLNTTVSGSVRWVPAISGYPCLMVKGALTLSMSSSNLSESSMGVNFNPPGTPYIYSTGSTDTDQSDFYPSSITGLVYASGAVTTSGSNTVSMLMVGGTLSIGGTLTLAYDATFNNSPPPGFYTVTMTPSQGTWRQVVDTLPTVGSISTGGTTQPLDAGTISE